MCLKRGLLLIVLLISVPAMSLAAIPANLVTNFKPLSGVIIMPIGDEYLIDLDMSQGVAEGDLFSVITPGEVIIHPVSGKLLGNLDRVVGWLKITRVKKGYSYGHPLGAEKNFTKGTQIKRYENIPALFWDYSGDGENLLAELRSTLPHLEWMSYSAAQALRTEQPEPLADGSPRLFFIHRAGQLEVRGADFQMLGQFMSTTASTPKPAGTAAIVAAPVPRPMAKGIIVPTTPTAGQQTGGIRYKQTQDNAEFWSAKDWAGDPLGVEIVDLDGDGANEIATLFKDRLEIGRISDRSYQQLSSLELRSVDKALNLSSADLDNNGRPELFISAVSGLEVNSLIIAEKNGAYQIVQDQLPWFLHATQTPDGGKIVLGQRLGDTVNIYSPEIISLSFSNGKYQSAGKYSHPWGVNIFSLQPFLDQQGEKRFAEIDSNDRIRILTPDGDKLWESSKNYGGSGVFFSREDSTGGADFATTPTYIKPRMAVMEDGTLLAPLNEGWRYSESLQSFGPGQVVALRWDGISMIELWHSEPQAGSLIDFQYADIDNDGKSELAELIHFSRAGLLNKGRAGLRVFEFK